MTTRDNTTAKITGTTPVQSAAPAGQDQPQASSAQIVDRADLPDAALEMVVGGAGQSRQKKNDFWQSLSSVYR